jgi:hypothetical protein
MERLLTILDSRKAHYVLLGINVFTLILTVLNPTSMGIGFGILACISIAFVLLRLIIRED